MLDFKQAIIQGIPKELPAYKIRNPQSSHAPKRKEVLNNKEKQQAVQNALSYFPSTWRDVLRWEFAKELDDFGHIYMYRFKPDYKIYARPIDEYPCQIQKAAAMMLMIQNNLDPKVAQFPDELVVYGWNGSVFQNWVQYLLTMKYLATMTDNQQLAMYSGYPMGLFPSTKDAAKVVITNGMMIPNYSTTSEYERWYALWYTQYGQMTAGSRMYIWPQGIVHGTTITLLNACRIISKEKSTTQRKLFVSSWLWGMSGAQAKASVIAWLIGVIAEINPQVIKKRMEQWRLDESYKNLNQLISRIKEVQLQNKSISLGYEWNIVDLREKLVQEDIKVDLGTDQTSLHNPYGGGYYPAWLNFETANKIMTENPKQFKTLVQESLKKQIKAINTLTERWMYFRDYGNAFLLEAWRAQADIFKDEWEYKYPSYVEDIMWPLCFDYGFGPFRRVCTSWNNTDLEKTDEIAIEVMKMLNSNALPETQQQFLDNIQWMQWARENKLVVWSQARILYADAEWRIAIAKAFNKAIREWIISKPIVIWRDHHDTWGTDSPYRETSNIKDGSNKTADMAIQNVIWWAIRWATWVSLHNGGWVGRGEVINGWFGLVLDGNEELDDIIENMLFRDVVNWLARRARAGNRGAIQSIKNLMKKYPNLQVTIPNFI